MSRTDTIIGIDLGTTNSEVAVVENGQVTLIQSHDQNIIPSVVGIDENNNILIGEPARNQYILYPERTIKSIKRKMGSNETVAMAGQDYSPQEISAFILKHLKQVAEKHVGYTIDKAVITVPAYFSDAQRLATREAGELAGLDVVRMINEPTAAALAYETNHHEHKKALVYDLGGGTFDVSVVSIEDNVVEVLASHGNNHLGGDDFDQCIINTIREHLQETHNISWESVPAKALARITRAAEDAKKQLTDQPFVTIAEEYLLEHKKTPIHLSLELARTDYESMIKTYIDETLTAVHTALKGANLTVSDIDEILLVGGATRTPVIHERLHQALGIAPKSGINPDLCVATGAAIQAEMIAGGEVETVLVDITPYTFGTSVLGMMHDHPYSFCYAPIIPKNSPLPITKTEAFCTHHDFQEEVEIQIYQGEDPDALNNIELGKFNVNGLSKVPSGNTILISLSLDLNGLLHVTATEKATGLEKAITIENALADDLAEKDEMKRRLDALFEENDFDDDSIDGEVVESSSSSNSPSNAEVVQAKALVEKAERMLDSISDEDRDDMVNLIESINDAIKQERIADLKSPMDELSDLIFYLDN